MSQRSMWKGMLKIGLVTVPVKMYAANETRSRIAFHQYHTCGSRSNSKKWCATCNKEITSDELVRGYEYAKGQHVAVSDADLESCEEASTHTLEVTTVVEEPIDPVYIDTTAYLLPEGAGASAFEVCRVALGERVAVGSLVMRDRAVQVALVPAQTGFVVYVLRAKQSVKALSDLDTVTIPAVSPKEVALAKRLFASLEGDLDYAEVRDEYTERVRAMLAAKVTGTPLTTPMPSVAPKAATLVDALEHSLKVLAGGRSSKLPPKAGAPAKAKIVAGRSQNGQKRAAR